MDGNNKIQEQTGYPSHFRHEEHLSALNPFAYRLWSGIFRHSLTSLCHGSPRSLPEFQMIENTQGGKIE